MESGRWVVTTTFHGSAREVASPVTRGRPGRAARLDPPQPDVPGRVRGAARVRAPLVRRILQGRAPHLAAAAQPAGRGHGRGLAAPVRRAHPARGAQDRRAAVRRARSGRVRAGVGYPILPLRCGARARAAAPSCRAALRCAQDRRRPAGPGVGGCSGSRRLSRAVGGHLPVWWAPAARRCLRLCRAPAPSGASPPCERHPPGRAGRSRSGQLCAEAARACTL